ncbi:N-formylglutamate amidohydrolase [Comamonas endophytica]|uniref:N-formylglutamate amidohydrolase n=1 Tax=Comamonas endophytica TaxID=2949090 RepID=A0ABY6G587_9BURK|nr:MULTISPECIES: N-formylglutamate amidohydrolase [unclassified Acidovorax]MCD2512393.1 N-formylglutamate amidohydrolase [Acidovorax sp. D4N7]UYG50159.1 N-formylglutamate amidohydrolase [Acidovorax sp. 5MLIR]
MFRLHAPEGAAIPLVCDSPHSGVRYPDDFGHAVPRALLRAAEDTHVEALWGAAPGLGATLVEALFPRSYLDLNRTLDDIDPELLASPWPTPLAPSEKTRLGSGLVWRTVKNTPIYDRLLSVAEVQQRIARCYQPYHQALAAAVESTHQRFGAVWHLNLHSMPNNAYERLQIKSDKPLADFVLGDRDGTTCEPAFVALVEEYLRGRGYSVARNDPYKGVQLIAKIGQPALQRHSMQIEIRRPIYMDEESRERNANFEVVQRDITGLLLHMAGYFEAHPALAEAAAAR